MIRAVIFDFFGVFSTDTWKVFCGNLPASADLERARELNRLYDAKLISHSDFVDGVKAATGATTEEIKIAQKGSMVIDQNLIAYIKELKKKYKIAVLSNVGTNQIRDYLLSKDEQALIDEFIFSYEVGAIKPDPHIYEVALQRLNVAAEECVFTDDGPHNVEGAIRAGMKGITYENFNQFKRQLEQILSTS